MARDVRIAILGDSRDFSRAVRNVQGDARKLDSSFGNVGRTAGRMGAAVAFGAGALAVGVGVLAKGFVDAAIESQKVTAQTDAVIKSMGDTAGVTAEEVADLSTKLSLQAGIDDELIQSGSNILLTFGKIRNSAGKNNKVFDRATEAALDMSVALGTDMTSASMIVGKALNDPIRGLTTLRRSGIQFTAQQEDQIKTMVEAGDVMGAQKVILDELDKQFGGSAAAQATAGEKLGVIWGNLQEQLGEKLLPIFEKVATWLGEALPAAIDWAEPYIDKFIKWFEEDIAPAIDTAAEAVGGFIQDSLEALSGWWDENGDAISTFGETMGAAFQTGADAISTAWNDVIKPAFDLITDWFTESPARMQWLAGVVTASFVAMGVAAVISAAAAVAAWIAPAAPLIALIGLVYALAGATDWAITRFDLMPKASGAMQWIIDNVLVPMLGVLSAIDAFLYRISQKFRTIRDVAAGVMDFAGGLPGGPSEATVNPLTGKPIKGGKAAGGMVSPGNWLVGERGPEILSIGRSGYVTPNNQLGSGGTIVNLTVNGNVDRPVLADMTYALRRVQMEVVA